MLCRLKEIAVLTLYVVICWFIEFPLRVFFGHPIDLPPDTLDIMLLNTPKVFDSEVYKIYLDVRLPYPLHENACQLWVLNNTVPRGKKTIRLRYCYMSAALHEAQLFPANTTKASHSTVTYDYNSISDTLMLHFAEDIVPGQYDIKLSYSGPFRRDSCNDLVRRHDGEWDRTKKWLITNLFQSIAARRVLPCWGRLYIKASFEIKVVHHEEYTFLSNMQIESSDNYNDIKVTVFGVTPKIAPSEVAFVMFDNTISQAEKYEMGYQQNTTVIWQRPRKKDVLTYARYMIHVIKFFLFGTTLNQTLIPKTDYLVVPNSPVKSTGSRGLILYREEDITYNGSIHFSGRKLQILKLLVRQEILQWFSEPPLVSWWWLEIWIRQSFATYFSHYFPIEPYYGSHLQDLFVVEILQPILHNNVALQIEPLIYLWKEIDEIEECLYSRWIGYKGAAILRMFENILTPTVFRRRILQYVKKVARDPSKSKLGNLLQDFDEEKNKKKEEEQFLNISDIMISWLAERYYPVVNVNHDYKTARITTDCYECPECPQRNIPVNILTLSNLGVQHITDITWVQCPGSINIPLPPDIYFVMVNLQQFAYYRVSYEGTIWERIAIYLRYWDYTRIPVQNRAQFIDDAYHNAIAGKISPAIFYNFISYLKRETHYVPWYAMFNILTYMSTYLELPHSKSFKAVVLDNLNDLLRNIGYKERIEDDEMTNSLRLLAARWACKFGHLECQKDAAKKLLRELKYSSKWKNLPWWKDWAYCMGVKGLERDTWLELFDKFLGNKNADAFKYLACTDNDELLIFYMKALITNARVIDFMRNDLIVEHYRSILKVHLRKSAVFKYVLENFENIASRLYRTRHLATLWCDIILNLHREQINTVIRFSHNVESSNFRPDLSVMEKILNTRLHQLHKLSRKFSQF